MYTIYFVNNNLKLCFLFSAESPKPWTCSVSFFSRCSCATQFRTPMGISFSKIEINNNNKLIIKLKNNDSFSDQLENRVRSKPMTNLPMKVSGNVCMLEHG